MSEEFAYYKIQSHVAVATIDHPPLNALDVSTKESIKNVFLEMSSRPEVRVVVLHGAGEKGFASGADIKAFLDDTPEKAKKRLTYNHKIYSMIQDFDRPVIAAIHGYCLGGALELALCCDIRYAAENAKLGFPEINLSTFPGLGGTKRSLYHIPLGRLKELIYTGRIMTAEEAFNYGLIEKVVPSDALMESALELAHGIADKGPLGITYAKKVLNKVCDLPLERGLELETRYWCELAGTEDTKEGARAFLDKRKPDYLGR